jgi:hypothetical protein
MSDDQTQALKEVAAGVFFAMLSLYDDAAERESVQLLRDMVSTGAIKHPVARSVLSSIARNSMGSRKSEMA